MSVLIDSYGREHSYLRLSITDRCNQCCIYCRPDGGCDDAAGPARGALAPDEIRRLVERFVGLGIRKVRLTGGEPLLRDDLEEIVADLAGLPGLDEVCLTTNGVLLADRAAGLRRAGLARINVSLDSLRPERFLQLAGRDHLERALAGVDAALAAGFVPLKLNVVVMGGVNDDEGPDFLELIRERPLIVRFIEYMPMTGGAAAAGRLVPGAEMRRRLEEHARLGEPEPGPAGAVAVVHPVAGCRGRVGFITPVSQHFCAACTRLRVLADGTLQTCLFADEGRDLRPLLASGVPTADFARVVGEALRDKDACPGDLRDRDQAPPRGMSAIGG